MNKLASVLSLALMATSSLSQAQDGASRDDALDDALLASSATLGSAMERISITANRKANVDTELAMSVHSVGKAELALDNGQHPAESLNSLAGVLIEQIAGGQGHKTAIRMPVNTSGYYLYLQDNIPIQSPAFFNHNGLWWSSFNSNVGRMEVLKGAGTALYGSGAVAATINVISEGVGQDTKTNAGLVLGEDEYQKLQLSYSDRVNAEHGYRVSGSVFRNEGWRRHTASERAELNLRHEYELSDDQRLVTLFSASQLDQEMAAGLTEQEYALDRSHSGLSDEVLAIDPRRKSQYARLSSQWDKLSGDDRYSLIGYLRHNTNDYTATWNANMPQVATEVNSVGVLALANFMHPDDSETTVGVDLEYSIGEEHSYQPLDVSIQGRGADEFVAGEQFYDDSTDYLGVSPYLQHQRQLTQRLTLTLGARYDHAAYDFNNDLGRFGDIGHGKLSLHDRSDSFSHLSPKASLNYQLFGDSSLYLRYANSFRLPTASSLYHISTKDSEQGLSKLKPEVSDTYELGYKANFETLTLDLALYYMDVDDGIVNAFDEDAGFRYLVNATRVIHKGVEVASDWQASESLNFTFAYSKSRHEFDEYQGFSGNEMMNAPAYIVDVRGRYSPASVQGLTLMAEWQATGDYWMDDANSRRAEGYEVINLKLHYKANAKLSFHARVLNLTDNDYVQSASLSYGKANINPGAPRTFYVGVDYQW
ncbi:TonB-dependent receptor [Shewanella sp. AS16]|uniref:TonB-dependent receptor n=1 Tax=Shewanella sp. AS16 TaxID=2907625 RepID=UPI001F372478|nr:TonB-dependent receptor [Shewanella sp. AS16]MCE9687123.1 TonB-dependent receptor [Shewanella sp. AS16]